MPVAPKKTSNDLVLLDSVLAELGETRPQGLTDSEFFEFFTFDQILKNFDLSADELLDGQLGGGDEGRSNRCVGGRRPTAAENWGILALSGSGIALVKPLPNI